LCLDAHRHAIVFQIRKSNTLISFFKLHEERHFQSTLLHLLNYFKRTSVQMSEIPISIDIPFFYTYAQKVFIRGSMLTDHSTIASMSNNLPRFCIITDAYASILLIKHRLLFLYIAHRFSRKLMIKIQNISDHVRLHHIFLILSVFYILSNKYARIHFVSNKYCETSAFDYLILMIETTK